MRSQGALDIVGIVVAGVVSRRAEPRMVDWAGMM